MTLETKPGPIGSWAIGVLVFALGMNSASAQPIVVLRGPEARRSEVPDPADPPLAPGVSDERLAVIATLDRALSDARTRAAALEERAALRILSTAEALATSHADVPGISRWLAEIEFAMAGVASAGMARGATWERLAEERLVRATTLDPGRILRAGEAPPRLVARAAALSRAVATGPRGTVRVRSRLPDARAFLDEQPLGPLPIEVQAPAGRHVLRVEAPGHRPWGRVIDLFEAETADLAVVLTPTNRAQRRRAIRQSTTPTLAQALLEGDESLIWVELAADSERVLVVHCDTTQCTAPLRLDSLPSEWPAPQHTEALSASAWQAGADWLSEIPEPPPPPPTPWFRRWSVWVAVATAAGVAAAAGIAAGTRQQDPDLRIIIDSEMP